MRESWGRDEVLTVEDVCSLLKVGRTTVYQLVSRKNDPLPARKVGREWRFVRSDVIEWLRRRDDPRREGRRLVDRPPGQTA